MVAASGIFQFTPLCEGRLLRLRKTRSAANFNSRPCVRGDLRLRCRTDCGGYFNSRPCVRGDLTCIKIYVKWDIISIHAPLSGATYYSACSHSRRTKFQFTPLCEGRRPVLWIPGLPGYFNSRPCVRGDLASLSAPWRLVQFQFTPLCEGRLQIKQELIMVIIFQFTPLCEGRLQDPVGF